MARNNYFPPVSNKIEAKALDEERRREFGERLRIRMNQREWSQSDLAKFAKMGRDAISIYIAGKRWPSMVNLKKLATALKTTTADLLPPVEQSPTPAPALQVSQHEDFINMRINQMVSKSQAARILLILGESVPDVEEESDVPSRTPRAAKVAKKTPRR